MIVTWEDRGANLDMYFWLWWRCDDDGEYDHWTEFYRKLCATWPREQER